MKPPNAPRPKRRITPTAHGVIDYLSSATFAAAPWLLGFADDTRARNFSLAMAGISAVVVALTQRRRAA